jgi:hypothetical protein
LTGSDSKSATAPERRDVVAWTKRLDHTLTFYVVGLAASFGISHIDAIHTRLLRCFPRTYPSLNVVLPCGRAIFLLAILERGASLSEIAAAPGE